MMDKLLFSPHQATTKVGELQNRIQELEREGEMRLQSSREEIVALHNHHIEEIESIRLNASNEIEIKRTELENIGSLICDGFQVLRSMWTDMEAVGKHMQSMRLATHHQFTGAII